MEVDGEPEVEDQGANIALSSGNSAVQTASPMRSASPMSFPEDQGGSMMEEVTEVIAPEEEEAVPRFVIITP